MRCRIERRLLILLGIGATVIPIHSQTKPQKPSFEVVSVKPTSNVGFNLAAPQGDRLIMSGQSLRMLLAMAYRDSATGYELEVFGGPDWMDSARYDVEAKADCSGGIISRDQQSLMMQSLLEERFQLKAHVETRDMPAYNLVAGKGGHRLKASADQTPPPPPVVFGQLCGTNPEGFKLPSLPPLPAPGADPSRFISQLPRGATYIMPQDGGVRLQGGSVPIGRFVDLLKRLTGRQVVDKTGITDLFDITLKFSAEGIALIRSPGAPAAGPAVDGALVATDPVPTLFTAIQDLGLKLEPARGPVQVVVIDSVRKPSEN